MFLETGCDTVDAHGHHVTLVPIMGTDQFGNPTMNWVPASTITATGPVAVEGPDDYDYDADPVVYPDDIDPGYLDAHGFYFHNGHYHHWHGGGPRYWAAHHGVVRDRNGNVIRRGNAGRRVATRTTVVVRKK
jgi:hypothetical protein